MEDTHLPTMVPGRYPRVYMPLFQVYLRTFMSLMVYTVSVLGRMYTTRVADVHF